MTLQRHPANIDTAHNFYSIFPTFLFEVSTYAATLHLIAPLLLLTQPTTTLYNTIGISLFTFPILLSGAVLLLYQSALPLRQTRKLSTSHITQTPFKLILIGTLLTYIYPLPPHQTLTVFLILYQLTVLAKIHKKIHNHPF